ncbi:hypothetical protein ACFLYX_01100 [Chloroflexota bacterium]
MKPQENRLDQATQDRINTWIAVSSLRGLRDQKVSLALVQTACTLALEGTNRATAGQITERAIKEYGIEAIPSFTGQLFSSLGVKTVTSHGRNRLVLDHEQLEDIGKQLISQCEEKAAKLESTIETFNEVPERIKSLEAQWQQIVKSRQKERELINLINEERQKPSRLEELKVEWKRLQEKASLATELEKECREFQRKVRKIPSLEERKKALEEALEKYEKEVKSFTAREQDAAKREGSLATAIAKLQQRTGWLELAELEEQIKKTREELDQVLRQLGEKRSVLDVLLLRKRGGRG